MRRITGILITGLLVLAGSLVNAQDPHFSQYFNMPVYYNPAAAGQDVEHIRLTGIYRNQWPSIGNAITTQGIQFDKQVSHVGLGIVVLKNSAGPSSLQRIQLGGAISYRAKFGSHVLAAGLNVGLIQKSIDPSKMSFDDQYIEDVGYDASNSTKEVFSFTHVTRPDFGGGVMWTMDKENSKWKPFIGASLLHTNKPKELFIIQENNIPIKTVYQAGATIKVNEKLDLKPSVMMQQQQFSKETMAGMMATFHFQDRNKASVGIYIRKNESAIIYGGYQWNSVAVGASYDMTTSKSISGPGAFELTMTYIPKARIKKDKIEKEKTHKEKATKKKQVTVATPEATEPRMLDSDKDGVPDNEDRCPQQAGLSDNHGCPLSDIDADGDGIPNKIDECPYIKGSVATHGCPDLDGDGVIDSKDHCPTVKGTAENNGCPVKNIPLTEESKMRMIKFNLNETSISGFETIEILEPISDRLHSDTTLQLMITGHTDEEGDEQYNMILSQNRADAVRDYFIRNGIAVHRIITSGYGESKPLGSNETEEGRSLNRRAEIYSIKKP